MSFGNGTAPDRGAAVINVTPLVDVVLVLLIIFMVLSPAMLREIPVAVPREATRYDPPPAVRPIIVRVEATGVLGLDGEQTPRAALARRVSERLRRDRRQVVFVEVEDAAPYGLAVEVMDVCKGAGARTIGILTVSK